MKLPLSGDERTLLRDLFDPRRAAVNFPADEREASRLHQALAGHDEVDLPRADLEAATLLLGAFLGRLAHGGAPVPGNAPLDGTVALAADAPTLQHIHAQLDRHLRATE
jgi:hypothetical protein